MDIVRLPKAVIEKKVRNMGILKTPKNIACRTLINEVMQTIKAAVDVA